MSLLYDPVIQSIEVSYLYSKFDSYNNEIIYFLSHSEEVERKLDKFNVNGYKLPWFKTKTGSYIFKIKRKYFMYKEPNKTKKYLVNFHMKFYSIEHNNGYFIYLINFIKQTDEQTDNSKNDEDSSFTPTNQT